MQDVNDRPDLLIIGAGSASFAAAIRATELGGSVMMVERAALGGTCVNVGCVPSKALIRSAEAKHAITTRAFDGITGKLAEFDFQRTIDQKDRLQVGHADFPERRQGALLLRLVNHGELP